MRSWLPGSVSVAFGERGMRGERVDEFGPFARNPGVGHVAGDEDGVERVLGVNRLELRQQPLKPLIAARARPPALDAAAIAVAHHVDIGEMHDPPLAVLGFGLVETRKRARLGHGGIGEAPSESGRAEIGGNGDGAVGESRNDHGLPRVDFREAAEEVGVWPYQPERERGESANEETGDRGGGGAEPSPPGIACIAGEEPLCQLPERFAERGIAGLHDDGVERPETLLD